MYRLCMRLCRLFGFPLAKEIGMVTDKQVRILMKLINQEKTLLTAAAKAGMCEKTARKKRLNVLKLRGLRNRFW